MSPREARLRRRIDILLDEREQLRERVSLCGRADRRCVYCGHRTRTARAIPVCSLHADLFTVDPLYGPEARL